ncbi:MAG: hypothetical protein ACRC42_02320 [Mycoplasma sp.]
MNKGFKSVITSFCTISNITKVKENSKSIIDFEQFVSCVGNKSVYTENELRDIYNKERNIYAIELLYNNFFGAGNNVNWIWLNNNGLFKYHPYKIKYNNEEFKKILKEGKINVQNFIID